MAVVKKSGGSCGSCGSLGSTKDRPTKRTRCNKLKGILISTAETSPLPNTECAGCRSVSKAQASQPRRHPAR
eukprot:scaffold3707_cov228-Pinguiococcus_pyrenoidosus.AAC.7